MEDDGDEIIETIPVFLSKSLANNLHVLQFPVVNQQSNFDKSQVVNSCVKPLTQQIKIDFALNTASKNYDAFKGDQLAIAADGRKSGSNNRDKNKNDPKPTFRSGRMDKQSYLSSVSMQNVERFCVGVIRDGEMYLTPIKGIYQMRPSFSYFDKQDKRAKADKKAEDGDGGDGEEEMKQVTVKFARNESEKVKKAREKSYNYISRMGAEEPWCETMWYPASSEMASMESQKLLQSSSNFTPDVLNMDSKSYVDQLISDSSETKKDPSEALAELNKVISNRKAKSLPLADQIKTILLNAKVVPFSLIQSRVTETNTDKLLRVLQTVGTLLRGNWVLQSELLYPENSVSSINGVPGQLMTRAREYVLYKFSHQTQINRAEIQQRTQLPAEEAKEVIASVGKLTGKVWELLKPIDRDFEKKYPELVQRQQLYWNAKAEGFYEMEMNKESKHSSETKKDPSEALAELNKVISNRKAKSLPLADQIKTILLNAKVVPFSLIQSRVTETNTDKLLRVLQTVGTLLRGNWVLQSELLYPESSVSSINGVPGQLMTRAREYVLYKFSHQTQINRAEIQQRTQLPAEEAKEVIASVGKLTGKVWELLKPIDRDFEKKYPELVQRQQLYWNAKAEGFYEMEMNKESKRVRKRSHRESK
uniref:CSON011946 protein n=1 Tax=Culicoides sonorensis TaxID=179676 RepID=A0A336M4B5_CULSO